MFEIKRIIQYMFIDTEMEIGNIHLLCHIFTG